MKTIFLTLVLFLNFFSFGQKIIVHVFERQEMVCFRKTSIDSVLTNPDQVYELDIDQTTYQLDLNDETFGARPIKRAIQDKIEDLISEKILMMEIEENKDYQLKVDNDEVIVSDKEEKVKKTRKKKE